MAAELDDAPADHDRYPVGVVRRVESMRDRNHRTALDDGGQGSLETPGGPRIEQRRRFVEHQRVRDRRARVEQARSAGPARASG